VSLPEPIVFVVDDDPSVREALSALFRSIGLQVQPFPSAQAFLEHARPDAAGCLILDVRLPGLNGLELQRELRRLGDEIPIIFITGHGDIPMSVHAMKAGAVEFLAKPFRDQELLDAIGQAVQRDKASRVLRAELGSMKKRYRTLTSRERQVMALVTRGMLNKQIAAELSVSEITIKVHRRHVMQKMQAASLADLVRIGEKLANTKA
jgi:FixJ family two-component response regulator